MKIVGIPLPFVSVGQVLDVDDLGPHRYDGATAAIDDERDGAFPLGEHNGLVYTCRGGFIDTAHVRETVDWTAFLIAQIDRRLETGGVIELNSDEGGRRRIVLNEVPSQWVALHGRRRVVSTLAEWLAYQISLWHEIAQWYGWSIVGIFPEGVSAFSPEDLYSNAVGVKLLEDANFEVVLASEKIYDRHVDQRIVRALRELGAVPGEVGAEAVTAVDQLWWDSGRRLPDKALVRRRYVHSDFELVPWLLPANRGASATRAALREQCGSNPRPATIRISDSLGGVPLSEFATLEIRPNQEVARAEVFAELGNVMSQADFPLLVENVRGENRLEFGPRADLPD